MTKLITHCRLLQAFNFPTYGKLLAILAVGGPLVVSVRQGEWQ